MKRISVVAMLLCCALIVCPIKTTQAEPITIVITTVVKKVIRAMDLAIQRLQNETIRLQNIQKAVENAMNKLKLNEIYEWTEKQRQLFAGYYDELWRVKNAISYYKRIRDIADAQVRVVKEYKRAIDIFSKSDGYTTSEKAYMFKVYAGILDQSVRNVDQIALVISSFSTQMSDAQRLEIIHTTANNIQQNLNDLRSFTNQNVVLGLQRLRSKADIQTLKGLYDLP